ncbi:hypothetical protein GCM10010124_10180 [Pilimelia terevasa]|uniref:Uncharacterized protein n=1 Tax=Pilimelia terevasa TaxID=53372 RepID=A0A8J3FH25_9ACTN|nr:hypothetical protein [Pilimelia terevasa]GGK19534.1 hypothetical protein GCM10010124_10180 [Pilimelia terevasa]
MDPSYAAHRAPAGARRPLPTARTLGGVGLACAAHLVTVLPLLLLFLTEDSPASAGFVFGFPLVGQLAVLVGCVVGGAVLIARRDVALGVGLLIGWLVGLVLALAVSGAALVGAYG